MMDVVPEKLDNAVILNVVRSGSCNDVECRDCLDIGGIVHNWLMSTELKYLLLDLQDEKDVCPTFLVEMLQLHKRLRFPMIFTGVMERPRKVLESYQYTALNFPTFYTPEEAIDWLRERDAKIFDGDLSQVVFGEPVALARIRQGLRAGTDEEVSEDNLETADI